MAIVNGALTKLLRSVDVWLIKNTLWIEMAGRFLEVHFSGLPKD